MSRPTEQPSLLGSTAVPTPGSAVNELAVRERSARLVRQRHATPQLATRSEQARAELANVQALCRHNRRDDTCPRECVVRQWRRGVPLSDLDGLAAFRREVGAE